MSVANNNRMGAPSSSDPFVGPGVLLTGGALVLTMASRAIVISATGNVVGKLVNDSSDQTYPLPLGTTEICFRSITSSTATGFLVF